MAELKLPDISDEHKKTIADIEAELKAVYDDEAAMLEAHKAKKRELNSGLNTAIKNAHNARMHVINSDPELKALHQELSQGISMEDAE